MTTAGPGIRVVVPALLVLTVALAAADTVVVAIRGEVFTEYGVIGHGWPLITVTGVASAAMGALILSRNPRQAIGWLLLVPGCTTCLSLALDAWSGWILVAGGPGGPTTALVTGWLASFVGGQIPLTANAIILLLAPDGRSPGRRRRVLVVVALLGAACWSTPPLLEAAEYAGIDPHGGTTSLVVFLVGVALVVVAMVGAATALVVTLRREAGVRRAQVRWFLVAGLPVAGGLVWLLTGRFLLPVSDVVQLSPLFVAELVFPLAIAVSVLRYRLYDIDLVLNRAWLLLGVTAFVGAAYVVVVVVAGRTPSGFWPTVLLSALVACAFQPVRSRLVEVADRLAYGRRPEPSAALADLGRRLGDTLLPQDALGALADACLAATAARAVRITLYDQDGRELDRAGAPPDPVVTGDPALFPVDDGPDRLGSVALWVRPGRPLRRRDRTLIADLCLQAGIAFRTLRLDAALRATVAELAAVTADLEASEQRRRVARTAEVRRLEETLRTDVTPHLERLADDLAAMAASGVAVRPDDVRWATAVDRIGTALTTLRAVSHGLHSGLLEPYGIAAAVSGHVGRVAADLPVVITDDVARTRFPPETERATYRAVVLALRQLPDVCGLELRTTDGGLEVVCATVAQRSPRPEMRDHVEGLGGSVTVDSRPPRWVVRVPVGVREP